MSNQALASALSATPVAGDDVDAVLDVMAAIDAALDPRDGIACFNRLYRETTRNVRAAVMTGAFSDVPFITHLDVVFANLYFQALSQMIATAPPPPRAWQPLLGDRDKPGVRSLQFALAGMNAHINRDLAVAMAEVAHERGSYPLAGSAAANDYLTINRVLADEEKRVKLWFENNLLRAIDRDLGSADDIVVMWSIDEARQAAWRAGGVLFHLRAGGHDTLFDDTVAVLDRGAEIASRGLLLAA